MIEVGIAHANGDKIFENRMAPINDSHGKVIKVICSSKDISKLRRAEERLLENNKSLSRESDQIKKLLTFLRQSDTRGSEITSFVIEECIKISETCRS